MYGSTGPKVSAETESVCVNVALSSRTAAAAAVAAAAAAAAEVAAVDVVVAAAAAAEDAALDAAPGPERLMAATHLPEATPTAEATGVVDATGATKPQARNRSRPASSTSLRPSTTAPKARSGTK
jgi:hypothetical protein